MSENDEIEVEEDVVSAESPAPLPAQQTPPQKPPLTPIEALIRAPIAIVLLLLIYFLLWPSELEPEGWVPPTHSGLVDAYAANDVLAQSETFDVPTSRGAADLALASDGNVYGGVANGYIVNLTTDERLFKTGGRPLGIAALGVNGLAVADAEMGLLSIGLEDGSVSELVPAEQRQSTLFAFGVDVAADNTIYFSDASSKFGFDEYKRAILDNRPDGRLLAYDSATGNLNILYDDLYFASGVAVAADQSAVFVAEAARFRIRRFPLTNEASAAGSDIWIENLPGYPLGLAAGSDGTLWVAIAQLRHSRLDQIGEYPEGRKIIGRIPPILMRDHSTHPMLLGFDAEGNLTHNLQDDSEALDISVAGVLATDDFLYWGTVANKKIGRIERP